MRGETDLRGVRRLTYSELLDTPGLSVDEAFARNEKFMQVYRPNWRLFPDVLPALQTLHGRGLPMGVVSNGEPDMQREKLERLGIAQYFGLLLTSYEIRHGKPEPEIFQTAANRFGVEPNAAIFVGDNMKSDVLGSQSAGMQAVWLNRAGLPSSAAVREIRSLAELPTVVGG